MKVMGILNATPDSFYPPSRVDLDKGAELAFQMQNLGASLLDIGGESTRPGSNYVDADEEIQRVVPLVKAIKARGCTLPLSIDTRKRAVAEAAFKWGIDWVNDVSSLQDDPDLGRFIAERGLTVVLMHSQGSPQTMQKSPQYNDVVKDLEDFFLRRVEYATQQGIRPGKIVLDPGIGFGKNQDHNLAILAALPHFLALGFPLLVGLSRKSLIGGLASLEDRLPGSLGGALACCQLGASYIRVHDVGPTVDALRVYKSALLGRATVGLDF
jgi:dihydropteroate synthase